jgi:hypothetical protein
LRDLAAVGGSAEPYLLEDPGVMQGFLEALGSITHSPFSCEYEAPGPLDPLMPFPYDQLVMLYTPGGAEALEMPRVATSADCGYGGWYYDVPPSTDPNAPPPSKIILCPCSCAALGGGSHVYAYLGCHGGPVPLD